MQQRLKGRGGGERAVNFYKLFGSLKSHVKSASWKRNRLGLNVSSKQITNMNTSQALDIISRTRSWLNNRIRRTGMIFWRQIESRDCKDSKTAVWLSSLKEYEDMWDFAKLNNHFSPKRDESPLPESGMFLEMKATELRLKIRR